MSTAWPSKFVILMPVFNDWEAAGLLLNQLDQVLLENKLEACVLLVNDASTQPAPEDLCSRCYAAIQQVQMLPLRRNVGNQRAITLGITHVQQQMDCEALVVMDADGEDDPRDVPRLLEALHQNNEQRIVFAARMKRSESWLFLVCYHLYRLVHFLLTGIPVRIGNFSIVPATCLSRLVVLSEMWNHYAAAVVKARIPYQSIPTNRAPRLAGRSRLNFVGLVAHGLGAISVFSETVGVRLLLVVGVLVSLAGGSLVSLLATTLITGHTPSPWVFHSLGLLTLLLSQGWMLCLVFVMMNLKERSSTGFLPSRDYVHFVETCEPLYHSPLPEKIPAHAA